MSFKEYLDHAWSIHATEPLKLADEFKSNLALMETEDDVMSMTHLIVHVCGEHLGQWEKGSELLKKIKNNATIKDKSAMDRYVAILNLGNNPNISIDNFSPSDQVRICAGTASALANLGGLKNTDKLLTKALELATGLSKEDPANRALAIMGNSIASSLEEKAQLNENEVAMMIRAAHLGRTYWEIAGTWTEIERAEYRLSQSYLKAGKLDQSLLHGEKCLEIIVQNGSVAVELFFAYEALVMTNKALGNKLGLESAMLGLNNTFDKLAEADQAWCKKYLDKVS